MTKKPCKFGKKKGANRCRKTKGGQPWGTASKQTGVAKPRTYCYKYAVGKSGKRLKRGKCVQKVPWSKGRATSVRGYITGGGAFSGIDAFLNTPISAVKTLLSSVASVASNLTGGAVGTVIGV